MISFKSIVYVVSLARTRVSTRVIYGALAFVIFLFDSVPIFIVVIGTVLPLFAIPGALNMLVRQDMIES